MGRAMRSLRCFRILIFVFAIITGLSSSDRVAGQEQTKREAEKAGVYVVPFSHLDLFWAGTREECLSRGDRIITKAIQIAQQYPQARYLLEDEVFVANYVETHRGTPELERFKRLVKEGRIEIGPKWAGIYQNLPRGEALARNLYYGKQYARTVFGVDPRVAHLGDLPGYTWQFPQIMSKSAVPYMVMTRMGPPDKSLFRWKSPDGSSALVWYSMKGYGWGVGLGLHRDLDENGLDRIRRELKEVQDTVDGPVYLGWGTDLWAPSEKVVQNIPVLNQSLAPWTFRLATPEEYFGAASKAKDVPELSGEIPSSWSNLLTTYFLLWPPVIKGTDTMLAAEKFAAINYALGYADYPQQEFDSLWKHLLEAMDHNAFGQGGVIGDKRNLEFTNDAITRGGAILRDMLRNIAERVRQPFPVSTAIVVFNPMNWTRDDVVDTHLSLYGDVGAGDRLEQYRKGMRLVDETGTPVPFRLLQSAGTVSVGMDISFIARGVPSLGYKTYYLVPAESFDTFANIATVTLDDSNPARPKRTLDSDKFENEFYVVTVDRATGGITIFDKELNRNVVRDVAVVGTEERGGNSIAIEPYTGRDQLFTPLSVEVEQNDPVKMIVRIRGVLAGVPVSERMFLYANLKKIDLETTVEWPQDRFMRLEQRFPYEQKDAQLRYGIPYASAGDGDIMPGSGPHQRDEVSVAEWKTWRQIQDWMFVGNREDGFTLSADRQLMIVSPGVIRAGMLRGTYATQEIQRDGKTNLLQLPYAGTYTFRYSLTSGKGDWAAAKSYRIGSNFANPLIPVTSVNELSPKGLPPTHSFLSLPADNLVVSALKKAEQDGSIILRVYDAGGKEASTTVELLGSRRTFQSVNLLEEQSGQTGAQTLNVKPYEIGTIRIKTN
jgi:alpha-mannosidase